MSDLKEQPQTTPADWVAQAQPGARITYYVGDLASDRQRRGVARLANEWLRLSDQRLVILLQKRLGPGAFAYLAARTATPLSEAARIRDVVTSGQQLVDRMISTT